MKNSRELPTTLPMFLGKSKIILEKILEDEDIQKTLKLKDNLVLKTIEDYKSMKFDQYGLKAISAYNGIQFKNINYEILDDYAKKYVDENVFIYSAFYGLNRASDSIYSHRLDFNNRLNLYNIWGEDISKFIKDKLTIDLASNEFKKLIKYKSSNYYQVIFKENIDGVLKSLSTSSKIMRGKMLNYLATNNIKDVNSIKEFSSNGFSYSLQESTKNELVFINWRRDD